MTILFPDGRMTIGNRAVKHKMAHVCPERFGLRQDGSMIVVLEANSEEELKGSPVIDSQVLPWWFDV